MWGFSLSHAWEKACKLYCANTLLFGMSVPHQSHEERGDSDNCTSPRALAPEEVGDCSNSTYPPPSITLRKGKIAANATPPPPEMTPEERVDCSKSALLPLAITSEEGGECIDRAPSLHNLILGRGYIAPTTYPLPSPCNHIWGRGDCSNSTPPPWQSSLGGRWTAPPPPPTHAIAPGGSRNCI